MHPSLVLFETYFSKTKVGQLAAALGKTLQFKHPEIAIATALSFASFLKSGKICAGSVTPNLYCLVLASSGAGKTTCQLHIETLMREATLAQHLMGNPGSDAGVLKALAEQPKRFLMWDEIGHALQELASNNSASYRKRLLKIFLELYSRNGRVYIGDELKTEERVDIHAPYFSMLGSSTKNRVFNALNDDFGHDGTLPRFLSFFESDKEEVNPEAIDEFPYEEFLPWIDDWIKFKPYASNGDLAKALNLCGKPFDIKELVWGERDKRAFDHHIQNSTDFEKVFWRRASEQLLKFRLCMYEPEDGIGDPVQSELFIQEKIREAISAYQDKMGLAAVRVKEKEKFSRLIKAGEIITKSELTKRAQHLNMSKQDKREALDELLEIGAWAEELREGNGFKKITLYRLR